MERMRRREKERETSMGWDQFTNHQSIDVSVVRQAVAMLGVLMNNLTHDSIKNYIFLKITRVRYSANANIWFTRRWNEKF